LYNVMLSVVMLSVVMLSVVMLIVFMLNDVMLSVFMLNDVAPVKHLSFASLLGKLLTLSANIRQG
jgi:hypothetical protein